MTFYILSELKWRTKKKRRKNNPTLFCVINLLNLILHHVLILPFPFFPGSCSSSSPSSSPSFVSCSFSSSRGIREIPPALLVSSSSSYWWESGRETRRLGGCLMRGLQYIVNVVNGFSSLRQPARIICTFDLSDSTHSGKSAFRWNGTAASADARELHHEPCRFMLISRNRHNIIWHQLSYFPVKRKIVHLIFLIRDFSQFTLSCNISLWPTC